MMKLFSGVMWKRIIHEKNMKYRMKADTLKLVKTNVVPHEEDGEGKGKACETEITSVML